MEPILYVNDPAGLREMNRHIGRCHRVSVDIESDSYHHYGEKICLVQISCGSRIFILDTLEVDPVCIVPLMENGSREKVFHDVDYDGRLLLTKLGIKPAPVFDTMIAARILGKEKVGLADLLSEYFGVTLDKGMQKADWSRRPLSEEMIRYAARDVAYLLSLRDRIAEEMKEMGRMSWAQEEFLRLVDNLEPIPERNISFSRIKGARDLSSRQLAVLQKLLEWREKKARKKDVPSFKIVGTERLLKLAQQHPRSRDDLKRRDILTPRQITRFGDEILGAVGRGMKVPETELPYFPTPTRQIRDYAAERVLGRFKEVRDRRAGELGLDPGFLLSNAVMKSVARLKPGDLSEIEESGLLKNWQLEAIGGSLAECL